MLRRSKVSTAFGRSRRSLPILPPWEVRMIYDMVVSKRLTTADTVEGAESSVESIKDICHLLQILALRIEETPPPPPPTFNINTLPADYSEIPSVSISSAPRAVNICATEEIAVPVQGEGVTENQEV